MNLEFSNLYSIYTLIFGLVVGSFLNVIIIRLPKTLKVIWANSDKYADSTSDNFSIYKNMLWKGRSKCSHCNSVIRAQDNIPILSYLLLRSICPKCKNKISIQYPIVETITGGCFFILFFIAETMLQWGILALFFSFLIVLFTIDINEMILPDILTIPLLWIGLLININGYFVKLDDAVIGAFMGYAILWSIFWLFKLITGKIGMGYGDFKYMSALGAWLGWQSIPSILLIASILGITFGIVASRKSSKKSLQFPFGPFLSIAGGILIIVNLNDTFSFADLSNL